MNKRDAKKLLSKKIDKSKGAIKKEKIVPDTSILIEGLLSKLIEQNRLVCKKIIVHEAVVAELEHQANKGRETGFIGLEELKILRELCKKKKISLQFVGTRPGENEIRHAKIGEIDALIRGLAKEENATLITADTVQALVAESKGIDVVFYEEKEEETFILEKFFDETTMSIHLKEGLKAKAKKGMPGNWSIVEISEEALERGEIKEIIKKVVEQAEKRDGGFIEIDRFGSTILQVGNYRIVITRPPFSESYELTAVRPIKVLSLEDYNLDEKLIKRLNEKAEGILIAGAPGHGKTTFAQALAKYYASKNKIVKTIEAPRDLVVPKEVTQYALSYGKNEEIRDILLLSRPDYTIFDEMRNTSDFQLFSDLRLSGVGMVGVVHATQPIDAIQRFVRRVELGIIPHVIDTVIFIKNGRVEKVLSLNMEIKVPAGMTEADLARPVIVVRDFMAGTPEYEIYTYGEETVVVPIKEIKESPTERLASKYLEEKLKRYSSKVKVRIMGEKAYVLVPKRAIPGIIGKEGKTVAKLEKEFGISISIAPLEESMQLPLGVGVSKRIDFSVRNSKKSIILILPEEYKNKKIKVIIGGELVGELIASRKAEIKVKKTTPLGKNIIKAIKENSLELML